MAYTGGYESSGGAGDPYGSGGYSFGGGLGDTDRHDPLGGSSGAYGPSAYAAAEPYGSSAADFDRHGGDPYTSSYSGADTGLSHAFDSMHLGGSRDRDPYSGATDSRGLADYDGGLGRSTGAYDSGYGSGLSSGDAPYSSSAHAQPYDAFGGPTSRAYSGDMGHSMPAYDDLARNPYSGSSAALGHGHTSYDDLGRSGLDRGYDDPHYSTSDPLGGANGEFGGMDSLDRIATHSEPPYGRDFSHRSPTGGMPGDPLLAGGSHNRNDSLGADTYGIGLSSPLTGHSPGALDYTGLPESFDLDPAYGGPRDRFGTIADDYSPYEHDNLGASPGGHYDLDHHHRTRSAVDASFGHRADDLHYDGLGRNSSGTHLPGAYDRSPHYGLRDDPGLGSGYGSRPAGRDYGMDGAYDSTSGRAYGSGPGEPYGSSHTPYEAAYEGPRAHFEPGVGSRYRTEDPSATPGAFSAYMDRQDPYGYESGALTQARDALHSSTPAYESSMARHADATGLESSLAHGQDTFGLHSTPGYTGTHPQLMTRHSPPGAGVAEIAPIPDSFSTHTHTPFPGALDADIEEHEPAYDYGSFAWSGRRDNEEERYHDLQLYQQNLLRNEALDDAARQRYWQERMDWEALEGEARRARWHELDDQKRWQLGLSQGYWGSTLEEDPLYYQRAVAPWSETGYIRPHPSFTIDRHHPIYNTYNQFYSPTFVHQHTDDHMNDKLLQAADLAAYSNALARDYSIREEERRRRWEDRLAWEALNQRERAERYRAMAQADRLRLGLGPHSYHSFHMGVSQRPERYFPRFDRLQTLKYELPRPLQQRYAQFTGRPASPSAFRRPNWELAAAYYDLLRYENELRHARNLSEAQRQKLWRQRIAWQQLGEAQRQIRWLKMKERERQLLGLDPNRFMGSRYATLGGGYRPGTIARQPVTQLQLEMPLNLQEQFRPYKGKSFRITNNPSWLTSALPGAKNVRNQLAEQKVRMAEINRRQAELHRMQAQKIRDREMESDNLVQELGSGTKIWEAPPH